MVTNIKVSNMVSEDDIINSTLEVFLPAFSIRSIVKEYASELSVRFNLAATTLHVMDNISDSIPTFFNDSDYSSFWLKNSGSKAYKDEYLGPLSTFRKIRNKYQKLPSSFDGEMSINNGIFSPDPAEIMDPIMDIFCKSKTTAESLNQLSAILTPDELLFFETTFHSFNEKVKKEIGELKNFNELANSICVTLEKTRAIHHLNQIRSFYCSASKPLKSINLMWTPGNCSGICYGNNIIVRVPLRLLQNTGDSHFNIVSMLSSIIVHELTHHISGNMPASKKQELTQIFLKYSPTVNKPHFLLFLEEPLVMASQMLFIKRNFDVTKSWFNDYLAKAHLPLLEDYINNNKPLDIEFIKKCADISSLMGDVLEECTKASRLEPVMFNLSRDRFRLEYYSNITSKTEYLDLSKNRVDM